MSDPRGGETRGLVACAGAVVGLAVIVAALTAVSGAGVIVGTAQGVVVALQAIAGMAWWAMLRRDSVSLVELVGMGLAVGTISAALCDIAMVAAFGVGGGWLIPFVTLGLVVLVRGRRLSWPAVRRQRSEITGLALSLIAGIAILAVGWIRLPLPTNAIPLGMHPDMLFFEALSRGLSQFGPADSLLMSGSAVRYHWFAYGWAGSLTEASGAPSFQALTRALPVVALIAACALAVSWARRMSTVSWVPTLAGLLVVTSAFVGAQYGVLLNTDSPSQQLSLVWSLAVAIAFFAYVRSEVGSWTLVVLALLGAACTGGKVSAGVMVAGGVIVVAITAAVRREPWARRAILGAGVVAGLAAVTYVVVLSGVDVGGNIELGDLADKASTFQGLNPFGGAAGVALGTAILALATLPRLAGLWPLAADRDTRWQSETVFAIATVAAGVAALFVLSEGINDLWFLLSASGPACVVAAWGVGLVAGSPLRAASGRDLRLIAVAVSAIAVLLLVLLSRTAEPHVGVRVWGLPIMAWLAAGAIGIALGRRVVGSGGPVPRRVGATALTVISLTTMGMLGRAFDFSSGVVSEVGKPSDDVGGSTALQPTGLAVRGVAAGVIGPFADETTRSEEVWDAAAWLSEAATDEAIVATSRPDSLEVPALTGLRMYLAGLRYQVGLGDSASAAQVPVREAVSRGLTDGPTAATMTALCGADVTWVWLETPSAAPGWAAVATAEYANSTVVLLHLQPTACPN